MALRELALFAGAGGGLLGSRLLGWRTVCAVEIDPYRQAVLLARQADGWLDPFPIWDDVRTFDGTKWCGCVDIVSAGFPCQPFSVNGLKRCQDDERNMWPDTIRVVREVRPRFCWLENVPGLLAYRYFGTILRDLAASGYDARWCVLGADDCGAPQRRKRLWIVAYPTGTRLERQIATGIETGTRGGLYSECNWWDSEPGMDRVADGVADRVDRLSALGDGQVPAVVRAAWELLTEQVTQ